MTDIGLFSLDDEGVVQFGLRNIERQLTGPEEAVQLAAYALFTEQGTNFFDRSEGGGLHRQVGMDVGRIGEIRTDAAVRVRKAMQTIRKHQSADKSATSTITDLKLMDSRVVGQQIEHDIRIDLADGNSFKARFRI